MVIALIAYTLVTLSRNVNLYTIVRFAKGLTTHYYTLTNPLGLINQTYQLTMLLLESNLILC